MEVDEAELKRQVLEEFARRPPVQRHINPRLDSTEVFPDEVRKELLRIQEFQRVVADAERSKKSPSAPFTSLETRVQAKRSRLDEDEKDNANAGTTEDPIRQMEEQFEGFPSPANVEDLGGTEDEDMAGFDQVDEFYDAAGNDPDLSLSESVAAYDDFVTVNGEDDDKSHGASLIPSSGFVTPADCSLLQPPSQTSGGLLVPPQTKYHYAKNPLTRKSRLASPKVTPVAVTVSEAKAKPKDDTRERDASAAEEEKKHSETMRIVPQRAVGTGRFRTEEFLEKARAWATSKYRGEYRAPPADEVGGMPLVDQKVLELLRGIAKEYIKELFGKIFSGNFNLTTISFPIKCMRPLSLLETFGHGGSMNPIYLNKAAMLTDPIERVKYAIVAQTATFNYTSSFLKPVLAYLITLGVAQPDTRRNV